MKKKHFTFGVRGLFSKQKNIPNTAVRKSCELYHGIEDLPLSRFIDAFVDGNLFALVKSGNAMDADIEELNIFWRDIILYEYIKRIAPNEYQLKNSIEREILNLELKLTELNSLTGIGGDYPIGILRNIYTKDLENRLSKLLHYKTELNPKNIIDYFEKLDKAFRMGNGMRLRLNLKRSELLAMLNKKGDGLNSKSGREYFTAIIVNLSDFAGYRLTESDITLSEYLFRIEKLLAHNKKEISKLSDKTNKR